MGRRIRVDPSYGLGRRVCATAGLSSSARNLRAGLTIAEVAVGTVLVGIVLVGALSLNGAAMRSHVAMNDLLDGPMLAEQLIGEIVALPYDEPDGAGPRGVDSGENANDRTTFDDVDDFDGWNKSPPERRDGVQMTEYNGWTREVWVRWADRLNLNSWVADTGVKRIEVCVTSPSGVITKRYAVRSREGTLEQPPTVDMTVVTEFRSDLQLGGSATPVRWSSSLPNHVEEPQ